MKISLKALTAILLAAPARVIPAMRGGHNLPTTTRPQRLTLRHSGVTGLRRPSNDGRQQFADHNKASTLDALLFLGEAGGR